MSSLSLSLPLGLEVEWWWEPKSACSHFIIEYGSAYGNEWECVSSQRDVRCTKKATLPAKVTFRLLDAQF